MQDLRSDTNISYGAEIKFALKKQKRRLRLAESGNGKDQGLWSGVALKFMLSSRSYLPQCPWDMCCKTAVNTVIFPFVCTPHLIYSTIPHGAAVQANTGERVCLHLRQKLPST